MVVVMVLVVVAAAVLMTIFIESFEYSVFSPCRHSLLQSHSLLRRAGVPTISQLNYLSCSNMGLEAENKFSTSVLPQHSCHPWLQSTRSRRLKLLNACWTCSAGTHSDWLLEKLWSSPSWLCCCCGLRCPALDYLDRQCWEQKDLKIYKYGGHRNHQ